MRTFLRRYQALWVLPILIFTFCDRSGQEVNPIVEFEITVVDTTIVRGTETLVDNLITGTNVFLFDNATDYDNAIIQRTNISGRNYIEDFRRVSTGKYYFKVSNANIDYYLFLLGEDQNKKLNVSNFGISGKINLESARGKGVKRSKLSFKVYIQPIDGNIIFYSTATNTFPLTVTMTNFNAPGAAATQVIPIIFAGPGTPDALTTQGSVRFQRDPGTFSYYAKSNDGCAWAGTVELVAGQAVPVNLSKCENGKISFFTLLNSANTLPIVVTINGQNLGDTEVSTLTGALSAIPGSCVNTVSTQLTFSRMKGTYSYYARSADTTCVWTGTIKLATDECNIQELVPCR